MTAAFASSSPGVGMALDVREAVTLLNGGQPLGGVWAGVRALGRGFCGLLILLEEGPTAASDSDKPGIDSRTPRGLRWGCHLGLRV